MARIDYKSGRVFERYVYNRFCNIVVFRRIRLIIVYEMVFFIIYVALTYYYYGIIVPWLTILSLIFFLIK